MSLTIEQVLEQIEADMQPAAAEQFMRVATEYFNQTSKGLGPVSSRLAPDELASLFTGAPPRDGMALGEVLTKVEADVVANSNRLYHPRYMGHQVTAPLPAAVWTEAIISTLNNSLAVQEMSPSLTMVERQIVQWMAGLVGFGAAGGGTLTSGGTEATFSALLAARARVLPDVWENGIDGPLPVVLCGEHAHYAVTRAAAQLGLGLKRVITVKTRDYRMDVADLARQLEELKRAGTVVMAAVATAGSTATGSFDDLSAIADLCEEHDIWLHVDGAHGASALLSKIHRGALRGIERARSVAWDPHKMMLMPLSVGVLLMRDEADLEGAFRQRAPYLFNAQTGTRNWDQGARSFQCSRRGDALKLWVALHRYGTAAFGLLYDHLCRLTQQLYDALRADERFEVIHEPACNILCFRMRGLDDEAQLAARMQYNTQGTGWITSTVLDGTRVLRCTIINPRITVEHLQELIAELKQIADTL